MEENQQQNETMKNDVKKQKIKLQIFFKNPTLKYTLPILALLVVSGGGFLWQSSIQKSNNNSAKTQHE